MTLTARMEQLNPKRIPRSGAIALGEMLEDIDMPSLEVPDLGSFNPVTASAEKDLFAPKKQKAWKGVQVDDARCDFAPNRVQISFRNPEFGIISLWKKSLYGRTLSEIKSDESMVSFFAEGMYKLIRQILGHSLNNGDWCLVTSPKRRHKERNFATLICMELHKLLQIPFYEDIAICNSKHRVGAAFTLNGEPPKERNIIVFDDFVTTGATMVSMRNLLMPLGYNTVYFTAINNKG